VPKNHCRDSPAIHTCFHWFFALGFPAIYLTVGYAMTLPLIVDKNLSPWQAMEMSSKVVQKICWKVAGLTIVMLLIFMVSLVPMGIVLAGVVHQHLFAIEGEKG